jgi:outer membrane lipoprotein SlyB
MAEDNKTWKDIAGAIVSYAPVAGAAIGTLTGGPAGTAVGGAAGSAIKAIASLFGIKTPDPTPQEIHDAIKADPEAELKLKSLDYQFQMAMREADRQEFQAGLDNIANARQRQVEHEKALGKTDINLYLLAWMFTLGFFSTFIISLVLILTGHWPTEMPPEAMFFVGQLNGTLSAGVGAVVQYFFGKTKDSAAHVNALTNSVPLDKLPSLFGFGNGKEKNS